MTVRLGAALSLVVAVSGCSSDKPPEPSRTEQQRGLKAPQATKPQTTPKALEAPKAPRVSLAERRRLKEAQQTQAPGAATPDSTEDAKEKKRDYGADLAKRIGSPVGCLKPRAGADVPKEIAISLTAKVMPSGDITRGSVSAGGLDEQELRCIQDMLERQSLAPPIEDAPRTVSTVVRLQLQPSKP